MQARDHGVSRVRGLLFLRTTRLLASFRQELNDDLPQWAAWVGHMADLDAQVRAHELRNLSSTIMGRQKDAVLDQLNSCRDLLVKFCNIHLTHSEFRCQLMLNWSNFLPRLRQCGKWMLWTRMIRSAEYAERVGRSLMSPIPLSIARFHTRALVIRCYCS